MLAEVILGLDPGLFGPVHTGFHADILAGQQGLLTRVPRGGKHLIAVPHDVLPEHLRERSLRNVIPVPARTKRAADLFLHGELQLSPQGLARIEVIRGVTGSHRAEAGKQENGRDLGDFGGHVGFAQSVDAAALGCDGQM